jgi:hypothetical protein
LFIDFAACSVARVNPFESPVMAMLSLLTFAIS